MKYKEIKNIGYLLAYPTLVTEDYVKYMECALSLLDHDLNTPSICLLSSLIPPINFFEAQEIILNAKENLHLPVFEAEKAALYFSYHLIEEIADKHDVILNLNILVDLCLSHDHLKSIDSFSTLYWAYDDLLYLEEQYYWDDMNRENSIDVIVNFAKNWLKENQNLLEVEFFTD